MQAVLLAASLTPAAVTAQADAGQTFVPSSAWTANGDAGLCNLRREFVAGTERLTLTMEALPFSDQVTIDFRMSGATRKDATIVVWVATATSGPAQKQEGIAFSTADGRTRVLRIELARSDVDRAAANGAFVVTTKGELSAKVMVPKLDAALQVLDRCNELLAHNAGLSTAEVDAIAQPPVHPEILFRITRAEMERGNSGNLDDEVVYRYIVGTDGKPRECGIVHAASDPDLNKQACILMNPSPLRFVPAKDRDGHPVIGLSFAQIGWVRH